MPKSKHRRSRKGMAVAHPEHLNLSWLEELEGEASAAGPASVGLG